MSPRNTIPQGISPISETELSEALSAVVSESLASSLGNRGPGHCIRVADLGANLMQAVALQLRGIFGDKAQVHILASDNPERDPILITSTKLVELRNPLPGGKQRPPLLVFLPEDLKASAEDSFGEATFETLSVRSAYTELSTRLLSLFPAALRTTVEEFFKVINQGQWPWADDLMRTRFLLCIRKNGYEDEVVGACLYELGLMPDFSLLDTATEALGRLMRNRDCVYKLTNSSKTERGKVMELGLSKETETQRRFIRDLGDFFVSQGLENPRKWTSKLALDRGFWDFTFDKWNFEDKNTYATQITVEVTNISVEDFRDAESLDSRQALLANQKVLVIGSGGQKSFSVSFNTDPHPDKIPNIDHFKLQIVSRETGVPVGVTKRKKSWIGGRTERTVSFTKLQNIEWEEGWHFVRVLAFTKDNDLIPLVDKDGMIITHATPREDETLVLQLNESESFYILVNDDVEVEATEIPTRKFTSVSHALMELRFKALEGKAAAEIIQLSSAVWVDGTETDRNIHATIEARLSKEGAVCIPVCGILRDLEQRILRDPDGPITWQISADNTSVKIPVAGVAQWPDLPEVIPFLKSRRDYFERLCGSDNTMISAGTDFIGLRHEIVVYAETYLQLLDAALAQAEKNAGNLSMIQAIHKIASLDRVDVDLIDPRKGLKKLSLIGPTHPLRAIWLLSWSLLGENWRNQTAKCAISMIRPVLEALQKRLAMIHFPAVLPGLDGRLLLCVENIHPFWSLYACGSETNPRGLVGELCTAFRIPEPSGTFSGLNAEYLADRIRRYVVQHPYVETLSVNCFNAGRARLLADTLLDLQRDPAFSSLRYDLRLFVPDPETAGIGEDLHNLVSPVESLAESEDVFCLPTGNHLAPKLSYSIRARSEFEKTPSAFPANISLLFDLFPASETSAEKMAIEEESAPLHGLLQDYKVFYDETDDSVSWKRVPRHGLATAFEDGEDVTAILCRLTEAISNAAANIATNQSGLKLRPASVLHLDTAAKALLHHVHEASDWVFTVDRNLGIEFFDHGDTHERPEYLIDHSPDFSAASGTRLVITSRSITEVEALFSRALGERDILLGNRPKLLFTALRSLSGRLALKMVSSSTQRAEALGLALAKCFLEYQGVFENQLVVPLDAHLDLYRNLQSAKNDASDATLQRTDLALFDFNAKARTIVCHLVEVKCYQSVGGISAYNDLKVRIAEQINQSQEVLCQHFDPGYFAPSDRPDRKMKSQEFVSLVEFYLDRAHRLNHLSNSAREEAKFFLRTIEAGYHLQFKKSAVIFDFDKDGTEAAMEESGIEYHRIGRDLINELLDASDSAGSKHADTEPSTLIKPVEMASIVKLEKPSFKTCERDRTVDWSIATETAASIEIPESASPLQLKKRPMITKNTQSMTPITLNNAEPSIKTPEPISPPVENPYRSTPDIGTSSNSCQPDKVVVVKEITEQPVSELIPDIVVGETSTSPQFGILGEINGRTVALDLNQTQTISLFGVQGGGKSYTLGSIIEMATMPIPGINLLPKPLASVVFHYSQTQDYKPEFTSMCMPNDNESALRSLIEKYKALPQCLTDILLLTPKAKLAERKLEYPDISVAPLTFSASELQASHWRFLMGAIGNQAVYIRLINQIMKSMRNDLTLENLKKAISESSMAEAQKNLAQTRLGLAEEYIDDDSRLGDMIRPGRMVIVDLRDEFIEKDEALGLFVVILQIFSEAKWENNLFNKLVVFDEAHKYIDNPDLVAGLVEVVREMRHKGTSILVASQDPPSVPISLIELSTQIILHRFNSPKWLNHLQKANTSLANLTPQQMAHLRPGEAFIWSAKSTDVLFSNQAVKVHLRPRVTAHGGETQTAINQ